MILKNRTIGIVYFGSVVLSVVSHDDLHYLNKTLISIILNFKNFKTYSSGIIIVLSDYFWFQVVRNADKIFIGILLIS